MNKQYDAMLIPGSGLKENGELLPWTRERLDYALRIWHGEFILVLSAGTIHKPPVLSKDGFPVFESKAAADYLIKKGVKKGKILIEASSYDTIGNAYFSRMIHCEPRNFEKLLIITSAFHMPRTEKIFNWVYGLSNHRRKYSLDFIATPDTGLNKNLLELRIKKEKESIKNLKKSAKINNLSDLHKWLFTKHSAYAAGLKAQKAPKELSKCY